MADISGKITRKSLKAKKKAAIKTIKAQAKEKIRQVKLEYAQNPEREKSLQEEKLRKKIVKMETANARISYIERYPQPYSLGEDLFSSISNGIATGLSVAAIVLLSIKAYFSSIPGVNHSQLIVSFVLFGAVLFITYLMSTLNHAIRPIGARRVFSIINHDSVYLLIAATFFPYITVFEFPATLKILTWIIPGLLIAVYSPLNKHLRGFAMGSYAILCLSAIGFIIKFIPGLNVTSNAFLVAGGLSYFAGALLRGLKSYKWTHSIFHLFAIGGSILHFFSIYYLI